MLAALIVIWALINPFIFTFRQYDADAKEVFSSKGMNISFGDYNWQGNNLHFARIGDRSKSVLLFVHGSPGCWNTAWDYFMDSSWHKDYELISIDRPGFGLSNYGNAKNLFEQSDCIGAFIKQNLEHRKIQLIGHSYGGPLVLQLCADLDTLIDKCIIMAGSVNPAAEIEEWQLNFFSESIIKWIVPGAFEQGMEELLWLKDDLKSARYLKGIHQINTPIIAIYGTKDNMVPYEPNVSFLSSIYDSTQLELHSMIGANHFLPWERYKEVKQIILQAE